MLGFYDKEKKWGKKSPNRVIWELDKIYNPPSAEYCDVFIFLVIGILWRKTVKWRYVYLS